MDDERLHALKEKILAHLESEVDRVLGVHRKLTGTQRITEEQEQEVRTYLLENARFWKD